MRGRRSGPAIVAPSPPPERPILVMQALSRDNFEVNPTQNVAVALVLQIHSYQHLDIHFVSTGRLL